jgi:Fe2+ transport system protein FeoA
MASTVALTIAPSGQNLRLINVHGGKRMMRRLAELGLTPGVEMMIIQDSGGPILVSVRNSRIALGRGIAHKLDVATI